MAGHLPARTVPAVLISRIGWFTAVTAVTAVATLAASQLLYATGGHSSYAQSLYESAMAAITGTSTFSRIIQVLLAIYSVAVKMAPRPEARNPGVTHSTGQMCFRCPRQVGMDFVRVTGASRMTQRHHGCITRGCRGRWGT